MEQAKLTRRALLGGAALVTAGAVLQPLWMRWLAEECRKLAGVTGRRYFFGRSRRELSAVVELGNVVFTITDPKTGFVVARFEPEPRRDQAAMEHAIEEFTMELRADMERRQLQRRKLELAVEGKAMVVPESAWIKTGGKPIPIEQRHVITVERKG